MEKFENFSIAHPFSKRENNIIRAKFFSVTGDLVGVCFPDFRPISNNTPKNTVGFHDGRFISISISWINAESVFQSERHNHACKELLGKIKSLTQMQIEII